MIRNYLKIAWRNMRKSKGHSFLNIMGLAIGISCCLILFMYVYEELTYDRYHRDGDRIYRVYEDIQSKGNRRIYAPIAPPFAPALINKYPQVEKAVRIFDSGPRLFQYEDRIFYEDNLFFAGSGLFEVLTFRFLHGDPDKALSRPYTMVLTQRMALKYFGNDEVLGKIITVDRREYEITGVVADSPRHTHLKYDFIFSIKAFENAPFMSNWHSTMCFTYIKLQPEVDAGIFEQAMMRIGFDYVGDLWEAWGSPRYFKLQRVKDIHLHSHLVYEPEPPGNLSMILLIAGIGVLVLIVACMNFVNLSTAKSFGRAREVGMRKVVGGLRRELMAQFWGESILYATLALVVSLMIIIAAMPHFNGLAGTSFGIKDLLQKNTLFALVSLVAFCGLIAGSYPAILLSSYRPVYILKGAYSGVSKGDRVRKVMVVFQFAISILLAVGTLIIFDQIKFMKNQTLGFEKEQKLVIPVRGGASISENYQTVKDAFTQHGAIRGATVSSTVPGRGNSNYSIGFVGEEDRKNQGMYHLYIDPDFIREYGIEMAAGRAYHPEMPTDVSRDRHVGGFLMNEAAVKAMGLSTPEEAVEKRLLTGNGGREGPVIGVTRDFHYRGLQTAVEPLIMEYMPSQFNYITLIVSTDALDETMSHIKDTWHSFFPDVPIESTFLDVDFNRQYQSEEQTGRVAGSFTIMGLIVACLGLMGLSAFTADQRTKEIGIRKVFGASVMKIVFMLSREYAKWVLIANVIAWPVAWFFMNRWLNQFATRGPVHLHVFIISGTGALILAMLTVSYQSIKAALTSPVESLRYE